MKRSFRELSVLGALAAVLVGMAIFAPAFFSPQPLLSLLTREAPTLVVACGMACQVNCRRPFGQLMAQIPTQTMRI